MAVPSQPTHNLQDDLSPGSAGGANTSSSSGDANFAHLQRAVKRGGTVPDYPSDSGTAPGSHGGGGGMAD
jgi:hypothetical protein